MGEALDTEQGVKESMDVKVKRIGQLLNAFVF